MPDLIGHDIGRYHIVEQLGEGGMATVYKAFDTRLERDVAIKVIRKDAFPANMHAHVFKRFEREAKALARLSHPNIVKIHDYGDYEGSPFLVMEYIPGGTLKSRMGKPFKTEEAVRLLLPIASALGYAHQHDIVHRDVKPANILISEKGQPVLSDFGIAKMLEGEEGATLTGTGVGIGTPEYMAPEQCLGQEVDNRTDIYSLGVVFYEMVAGKKPFTANTPMAVVYKQISDPMPRPGQFVAGLPEAVETTIYKALAKNPSERYANMGEFAFALERLTSHFPTQPQVQSNYGPSANEMKPTQQQVEQHDSSLSSNKHALPPQNIQKRPNHKWLIGLAVGFGILLVGGVLLGLLMGGIWLVGNKVTSTPTITRAQNGLGTTPTISSVTAVPSLASTTANDFKIISTDLNVNPPSYQGSCKTSVKFTFSGMITANGPGTVQYHFVRSDNATGPVQSLSFSSAGSQPVSTYWALRSTHSGWEQIYIDSPNHETSGKANFSLTCIP